MGNSWGGHLPNLPLKHLGVIVFPSAKHFSENAGSSEVNDPNHVYLLLGYQHLCSKRISSQALEQHLKAEEEYMPPNILHKIFLDFYPTCFLTLYLQIYKIFPPKKGYTALNMGKKTYPVQNQTDIQCWCSIQGKSASESSGRGDPGTYKFIIQHYRFLVIIRPTPCKPLFLLFSYQMFKINYS